MRDIIKSRDEYVPAIYMIIMFIVIYFSHDTLLFGTSSSNTLRVIKLCMPLLILGIVFLKRRFRYFTCRSLILLTITCALPVISCFINDESFNNYAYRLSVMLAAGIIIIFFNSLYLYEAYNRILAFMTLWSLATFLLSNIARSFIYKFPVVENVNGFLYHFTGFSVVPESTSSVIRNHAIFREPGVFVVFLVIAIIFELMVLDKKHSKRLILFYIGLLSTLSTAGYIIMALILVYMVLINKRIRYRGLWSLAIVVVAFGLIYFTNIFAVDGDMLSKFTKGSNSYGSWFARMNSVTGNLSIASEKPVFGIGRFHLYDRVLAQYGVYKVIDNTNSMLINFAAFGYLYGSILFVGLFLTVKKYSKKWMECLLVFFVLFFAFSNEDIGQNIFYYILIYDGLLIKTKDNCGGKSTV